MEFYPLIWMASLIGSAVICSQKGVSRWYIFWTLFLGPLGLLITWLATPSTGPRESQQIIDLKEEITHLKLNVADLQRRMREVESSKAPVQPAPPIEADVPSEPVTEAKGSEPEARPVEIDETPSEPEVVLPPSDFDSLVESSPLRSKPQCSPSAMQAATQKVTQSREPSKAEINFGQFWLNKIGIVIFTLGIGFFISYSFKYFPPIVKNAFGYAIAGGLFYLGRRFEKDRQMRHYGLALMGAGWALTYFVTYALHHFDASRVIDNQIVDMCLLFVVAAGMMWHSMKVKSETMMMVSLGTAYVTSLVGTVTAFTFVSSMILGCVAVFLLYRFQWVKTLFLGIGMTYGIHQFFIAPSWGIFDALIDHGSRPEPRLNLMFLSAYWALFFIGTHVVRGTDDWQKNCVSAANFMNFTLFFVMSGGLFQTYYPDYRVITLVLMAVVYAAAGVYGRVRGQRILYAGDCVVAVFALTLATSIQYLPQTSLMIALIQTPFLYFMGTRFKDRVLKYLSFGLSGYALIRFVIALTDVLRPYHAYGAEPVYEWTALVGTLAMGACFWLARPASTERTDTLLDIKDAFVVLTSFYLNAFLWLKFDGPWLPLVVFLEVPLMIWAARRIREDMLHIVAQVLTWLAVCLLFIDFPTSNKTVGVGFLGLSWTNVEWTFLLGSVCLWISWALSRYTRVSDQEDVIGGLTEQAYSALAAFLMTCWVLSVFERHWMTVALTVEALALFGLSRGFNLKRLRIYAYIVLGIVLARFIGVDRYASLGGGQWLMIAFELVSVFGLYVVSTLEREDSANDETIEVESGGIFFGFILMTLWSIFKYAAWGWRSLCLGVGGVLLILFGLVRQDKVSRIGGFGLLALSLVRIILVDLARLPTIFKIISFIIIGGLLLGLSFMYNKSFSGDKSDSPSDS